jgi:hypothetical protein
MLYRPGCQSASGVTGAAQPHCRLSERAASEATRDVSSAQARARGRDRAGHPADAEVGVHLLALGYMSAEEEGSPIVGLRSGALG